MVDPDPPFVSTLHAAGFEGDFSWNSGRHAGSSLGMDGICTREIDGHCLRSPLHPPLLLLLLLFSLALSRLERSDPKVHAC